MGVEEPVISGAAKVGGFFISPLGRTNLIITGILFIILLGSAIAQSVQQRSFYPVVDATVLKIIGADSQLGMLVDNLELSPHPMYSSNVFSTQFVSWLWFWTKFWFSAITDMWFIYFVIWLLYGGFMFLHSDSKALALSLALVSFIVLTILSGMIIYNLALAGKCLVPDQMTNFNAQMVNVYPMHGTLKFFDHFITGQLFREVASWTQTGLGQAVSNIPLSVNTSQVVNSTNISAVILNGTG